MNKQHLRHEFVDSAPDPLEPGVLYVSIKYATTMHLCCCGCGHEAVLPLSPTAWRVTYDGETVSLSPSVGNWSFPCRSHYLIDHDAVRWVGAWSDGQIAAGRRRTLEERGVISEPAADGPAARRRRPLLDVLRRVFSR